MEFLVLFLPLSHFLVEQLAAPGVIYRFLLVVRRGPDGRESQRVESQPSLLSLLCSAPHHALLLFPREDPCTAEHSAGPNVADSRSKEAAVGTAVVSGLLSRCIPQGLNVAVSLRLVEPGPVVPLSPDIK